MVKVTKSNATFALALLLGIPAVASQPDAMQFVPKSTALVPVVKKAAKNGLKAVSEGLFKLYKTIPSWNNIKTTTGNGLSWAGTGVSTVARRTVNGGKVAFSYISPAAKTALAFVGRHPTQVKIIAGTVAALGLAFAGYKAYNLMPTRTIKRPATQPLIEEVKEVITSAQQLVQPVTPVVATNNNPAVILTEVVQPTTQITTEVITPAQQLVQPVPPVASTSSNNITPEQKKQVVISGDLALLEQAKIAAETDIAKLMEIKQAGQTYAQSRTAAAQDEYLGKYSEFTYAMDRCPMPEAQKGLRAHFTAVCQGINGFLENEDTCLDTHKAEFDSMIEQLSTIIEQLDEAIAIEMTK